MSRTLFRFDSPASVAAWSPIDDVVMGGMSRSRLRHDPAGHAVFEGRVSLEQNGGFASVRSGRLEPDRAASGDYLLELCGDGKRYKFTLRTDAAFDGLNYQAVLAPPDGAWTVVRLPCALFVASFRGRAVPGAPPLDPRQVRQAGLMIAERQAGPFALALRSIAAE